MASIDKIPFKQNVSIGSTLDDQLRPSVSPFDKDSLKVFVTAMEEMKCNEDASGQINFEQKLVEDQSDISKYLGVGGALSLTYGPVSGNADVQFIMDNVKSDLDISLLIKATHRGEYKAANEVLLNELKLKDNVCNRISNGMTQKEFTKKYGKYLIIGIENGGKMLYQQTIKAKNKSDKLKAHGSLHVKLNQTGFAVEGSVNGEFRDEKYSNHVAIETKSMIEPSYNDKDDLIGTVIGQLERLTDPKISKNDDFIRNHASLKSDISKNLQKYFAAKLEPIYFIVKELKGITCVDNAFDDKNGNWDGVEIEPFFNFSNKLFARLKWMQNTIKRYDEQMSLDLTNKDDNQLNELERLYKSAIQTKIDAMASVGRNKLYDNAIEYSKLTALRNNGDSKEDNDKKEVCKPFIQIRISELTGQFSKDIQMPLEKKSDQLLSQPNEIEQKLKLFWVFGNNLHAKLVLMQCTIKDYQMKLLGALNLNDENDKKLDDNISKWQKQITKKIFHLSSIGEKEVGEVADNYYKRVNEEQDKTTNNDNKGEIEKNWVQIDIAQLEKEFEEEIENPSKKRLLRLSTDNGHGDDDEKLMDNKWVNLDLLPCHVANVMIEKEVNCQSLNDLKKLSKIRSQNCILNLMNASLSLTPLSSDGLSELVGKCWMVISVKSGLAIDVPDNTTSSSHLQLCGVLKNSKAQHFAIKAAGDGYGYLQCIGSKLYWDIGNKSKDDSGELIQYSGNNQHNQQFGFVKINNNNYQDAYMIINRNSNKAISILGKHGQGEKINQSNANGNNNQLFRLEKGNVVQPYYDTIDNGGWRLVRRVKKGYKWHAAKDHCNGNESYGLEYFNNDVTKVSNEHYNIDHSFSIQFDKLDFKEFLFSTGDGEIWVIVSKSDALKIGTPHAHDGSGMVNQVLKSSNNKNSYNVRWFNRKDAKEDPWISLGDHFDSIADGTILYGGSGAGNANMGHSKSLMQHNGANVWIR